MGKIVLENNDSNSFSIEPLAKGIYILVAFSGEEKIVSKFLVE
jgi:hypothetical protein